MKLLFNNLDYSKLIPFTELLINLHKTLIDAEFKDNYCQYQART